ncbi:lysoplasmalogenase [Maribacter sp. ANRC-HE7]|uniref:Lysoplasmalogenase n=1 Tax=Maribacter aquimaris TaxID=2737171 RepID=A0ABR7UZ11_9FLAO|nr:lysoplasmalogenase [Maribacter aquimaris]MBD0776177.1 lysoplasmalogenase [Maribacter aquimaris]
MSKANRKPIYFLPIFTLLVLIDLYVGSIGDDVMRHFTKPLILFSLFVYFAINGRRLGKPTYPLMLTALFFSWLGDAFLMYDGISSNYFVAGLLSFLLAHVVYAILFFRKRNMPFSRAFWFVLTLLVLYGAFLFFQIQAGLGALKIPVIFYVAIILLMALAAFGRKGSVPQYSFNLVFWGALFFIASDSILAINKFLIDVPYSHLLIMGTYATAQYLITRGILVQENP